MNISESVAFILGRKDNAIQGFYDRFLEAYPQVGSYFTGIDLRRQSIMLTIALASVEAYYTGNYPALSHYLRVLGKRHLENVNVRPEHYPLFRECLLATLEDIHGDQWDADLQRQWGEAIDKAIETMLEGYKTPSIS